MKPANVHSFQHVHAGDRGRQCNGVQQVCRGLQTLGESGTDGITRRGAQPEEAPGLDLNRDWV